MPRLPGRVEIGPGFGGVLRLPKDRCGSIVRELLAKGFPIPPRLLLTCKAQVVCRDRGSDRPCEATSSTSHNSDHPQIPKGREAGYRFFAFPARNAHRVTGYVRLGKESAGITCWVSRLRRSAQTALEIRFLRKAVIQSARREAPPAGCLNTPNKRPAGLTPAGLVISSPQKPRDHHPRAGAAGAWALAGFWSSSFFSSSCPLGNHPACQPRKSHR